MMEARRVYRALEESAINDPLHDVYIDVLAGRKTWKEYLDEWQDRVKKGDRDAIDVGTYHVLRVLRNRSISARDRTFWQLAERVAAYMSENKEYGHGVLADMHGEAAMYAKEYEEVLEHPEFWRTLIGTAYVEHMGEEDLEDTFDVLDRLIVKKRANPHAVELGRTIMELAEMLKEGEKNSIRREELHRISQRARLRLERLAAILAGTLE